MSASKKVGARDVPTSSSMGVASIDGDIILSNRPANRGALRPRSKAPADHVGAVKKFAALAQETRLAAFRLIIAGGKDGCPAGVLADELGIPATTLSFHLASLVHAGLVSQHRAGRQIIYIPIVESLNGLITYMIENCCSADHCSPICDDTPLSSARQSQRPTPCGPKVRENAPRALKARGRAC